MTAAAVDNGHFVRIADLDTADLLSEPLARAAKVGKEPMLTSLPLECSI
ncbi:hypothetical protein [Sulfitobacter donghicola]|nr:hypothetical protein [Sulfitobacter donghicola]